MRTAALVFLVGGLALLAWDVLLIVEYGWYPLTVFIPLLAAGLLCQGYALFRSKKGVRWIAFFCAVVIATLCTYMAGLLVLRWLPHGIGGLWPQLGALITAALAFWISAVLLAFARSPRPNPALNRTATGRPSAGPGQPVN